MFCCLILTLILQFGWSVPTVTGKPLFHTVFKHYSATRLLIQLAYACHNYSCISNFFRTSATRIVTFLFCSQDILSQVLGILLKSKLLVSITWLSSLKFIIITQAERCSIFERLLERLKEQAASRGLNKYD